eukprot:CAMPEP_0177694958 /NCGR_PEP_ID=MMETSP0484_2-20121128/3208_1 /TAXON_ID=354590 /ORGANISM="Rhodomonas lens, Strain RHODO" /LENGTH=174 /DNA_ID=CAMNT_0019205865 /DNA_START=8 /DNA_END=532 /DNA_ORIENTATION=+
MAPKAAGGANPEPENEAKSQFLLEIAAVPFVVFRCPMMKLRFLSSTWRPSKNLVLAGCFVIYFLLISGIIYDYTQEPPFMGHTRDPRTGMVVAQAFMKGRVNAQYMVEGLAAGMLFCAGGGGFILLEMSQSHGLMNKNNRHLLTFAGLLLVLISYSLTQLFIRMKIPSYLAQTV